MAGILTLEQLKQAVASATIDTVIACQVDMQGRLMGKRFQAEYFLDSAWKETHSCNYLLATDMEMETVPGYRSTSWASGYGDYTMRPDLSTLRNIPWLEGTALVLCDVYDHHGEQEIAHSPRAILKHQIGRLEKMNMQAFMATELEFFVFDHSYEQASEKGYHGLKTISSYNEDYHIFQTTKEEALMRAIRNGLQHAGVEVENSKGEACSGQEEINVRYADALSMADRHAIVKNGCKEIAWTQGKAITFMAKWNNAHAGNSSHIHQSLWSMDGQTSLFFDKQAEHGMSQLMRHYLAGLLKYSADTTYFVAPFVNSYKRFQAGTFAPTKAVWSLDNRTAGYRVCAAESKSVRVECRIGGADLNPYLALAAQLAAGISGIEQQLELETVYEGDAYAADGLREIPKNLRDATTLLTESKMLRQAMGDDVIDHYTRAASWEQQQCDRVVTDWERIRGFERA